MPLPEGRSPPEFFKWLADTRLTKTTPWSRERPDVFQRIKTVLEFCDGFCMDNDEERDALADILTCALLDMYAMKVRK